MHVLILTLGSRGDVQPYVALGAALRARGHAVTLSTGRGFEAMIEAQGVSPAPLSVDIHALIQTPEMQRALRTLSGKIRVWRDSKGMVRRQFDEMWAIARRVRPDVIVYHAKAFAAAHIAEALQAVAVPSFQIPAFVPTDAFASPFLPLSHVGRWGKRLSHAAYLRLIPLFASGIVNDWRHRELGLAQAGPRDPFGGHAPKGRSPIRLHGYSRHLVPVSEDWGEREHVTGYWFLDQAAGWRPPKPLERFLGQGAPPVYVGFGSMPAKHPERMTRTVLDALRATGRRGILATGWGGLKAVAGSDEVYVLDGAPHDWLFPRCAAVVHHGGAGTTHEALRWGRPSVICPVFGDQPFWGRRVMELGAGPRPLPQRRMTAATLARALEAALSPAVASRAAAIGGAMRDESGADGAASAIETMAAAR